MVRACVAVLALGSGLAYGQAQLSSGDLTGMVVDPAGGRIARARITAVDTTRGIKRTTESGETGEYRITLLPPGLYQVSFEASGFTTRVFNGVEVRVGDTVPLRAQLAVGAEATAVVVVAEPPPIEPERTQQATTIDSVQLRQLPINRRNYLDFALLAPGVVETDDLVDGTDFRIVQAPQSGLSFGGSNGRGNSFALDGAENTLNTGGVRPSVGQEVVQEFQINRNSYSAEFGDASGGAVNIVTKSGSSSFHGNLFGYLRDRSLQARNYFDSEKSAFTRAQYGATIGGPIIRDKTFFFAGFERLDRHETAFVPIQRDWSALGQLTASQQQLADFLAKAPTPQLRALAPLMRQLLIPTNYPDTIAMILRNSGNFPFQEGDNQASLRLDHRFNDHHNIFARANLTTSSDQNAQFGALIAYNRGDWLKGFDRTGMLSDTYIFNTRWVSETRAMAGSYTFKAIPTDPNGPEINIPGVGFFGRDFSLPSVSNDKHFQLQQTFGYSSGRHNVRFGAGINPVGDAQDAQTYFSGQFTFGESVPLATVLNTALKNPAAASNLVSSLTALGQAGLAANVSTPISAAQAFDLGLPDFYQQGFGNPHHDAWFYRYNGFVQDSFRLRPNLLLNYGARYDLQVNPSYVPTDRRNLAPRVALAWSPGNSGKTVVRAGFGLYYAPTNYQEINGPATLDGKHIFQVYVPLNPVPGLNDARTGLPLTSATIYQTLLAQGIIGHAPITPADLAQFGWSPAPLAPYSVIFGISPHFVNPYSEQGSFEIEHAFGGVAVSAAYMFNRGAHLPRALDENLYYSGRTAANQPTFGFINPAILQDNVYESTANSYYHAATLQVSKRFSGHYSLNAHYTFSKAIDDTTDFNSDFEPNDQLNARAERALSSFNQKHRLVTYAVFDSPLQPGRGNGLLRNIFGGFNLSPIVVATSGQPFNILTGYDNLGDRHSTTHRPFGAGRNIGQGPNFATVDLRLSRRFTLGERRSLEFSADGFNVLNRTNFKTVNNTVGATPLEDLPRPLVGIEGAPPITPLAFTSAFDPRQIQLGLKLAF